MAPRPHLRPSPQRAPRLRRARGCAPGTPRAVNQPVSSREPSAGPNVPGRRAASNGAHEHPFGASNQARAPETMDGHGPRRADADQAQDLARREGRELVEVPRDRAVSYTQLTLPTNREV